MNLSVLESTSVSDIPITIDSTSEFASSTSKIATNSSLRLPVVPVSQPLPSTFNTSKNQNVDEHEIVREDELIFIEELDPDDLLEEDDLS